MEDGEMKRLEELWNALLLSEADIKFCLEHIGWGRIIGAIAETFVEEALGNCDSPPKTIIPFEKYNGDYRAMPAKMGDLCGCKIIGSCVDNGKYNLPLAMGTYILHSVETLLPLLIMDANITTAYRTAAATAVAVKELFMNKSKKNKVLGIIGCGQQAYYHIPAIAEVLDNLGEILVFDIDKNKANVLAGHFIGVYTSDKEEIFNRADVIVTLTPTKDPHIFLKDIPHREMLICGVGGDSETKLEMEPAILPFTDWYCDSYLQVEHTGIVTEALKRGLIKRSDMKSLGDYMVGKKKASSLKVKLFLSTGVALEDLAIAKLLYEYYSKER